MIIGARKFPIPANWNDFENVIFHIFEAENPGCIIHRYGHQGQAQDGIDIYIQNASNTVIQCKDYELLDVDEIDEIIGKITFSPRGQIIIATAGKRDKKLQDHVIKNYPNNVDILFWEDIEDKILFHNLSFQLGYGYPQTPITPDFFYDLTEIVKQVCYGDNDGYLIHTSLLYLMENKIPEYMMPTDLSLWPLRNELSQIANVLSNIVSIFNPQFYHSTAGDMSICFNMHYKNDRVLEENKKNYLCYALQLSTLYKQLMEKLK